ncbi:MAG: ribosome maturation factor RimM [Oscillospiraceae bacterium]|nr:ribosome maturation factor RimM [Oscillospiraceae bacterium]
MEKNEFIEAGRIVNTHGIAGEVKIEVWLDSPQFMRLFPRLFVDGAELKLLSGKPQKRFLIAKLEGVDDVNAAMRLKGRDVYIARADAKLPKGRFFVQDLLGASVRDESGAEIGLLADIMTTPASDVYVVRGETEHLIPAVPEFIMSTDAEAGIITVRLIEGM